jgi:hypothetical protein
MREQGLTVWYTADTPEPVRFAAAELGRHRGPLDGHDFTAATATESSGQESLCCIWQGGVVGCARHGDPEGHPPPLPATRHHLQPTTMPVVRSPGVIAFREQRS